MSAEEPAGNSTVSSIGPRCGKAFPARRRRRACSPPAARRPASWVPWQPPQDSERISATSTRRPSRGADPREDDGERRGAPLAVHLGLALSAHGGGELVELLQDRVAWRRPPASRLRPALEEAKALVEVVIRGRLLAVDIEQIILGRGRVAGVQRRERAALVLEHQAGDIGVVPGQDELRQLPLTA